MYKIENISFDKILPIWKEDLWPGRISPIETHSAMLHLSGKYDMGNFLLPAWYFGVYVDDKLVGVNSGHLCTDNTARSRGLWVSPLYRKKGYGKKLLIFTADLAKTLGAVAIWSYSRKTSWPTYESTGYKLTSDWQQSETSEANAYCYMELN
jgi:GNAT superfamily N-acetyltransferase